MSISLSMPISCSLEIPNSAARSWIRVVATYFPRYWLFAVGYQTTGQRRIGNSDCLYRRLAQPCPQLRRYWPTQHRDALGLREPRHFLDRARAGILRQHHARQLPSLQPCPDTCYADHHISRTQPQTEQAGDACAHAAVGGPAPGVAAPGSSSSPPSSVISFRKAIIFSASSGDMPLISASATCVTD